MISIICRFVSDNLESYFQRNSLNTDRKTHNYTMSFNTFGKIENEH